MEINKKTNICRWLENEFPNDMYQGDRASLKIKVVPFEKYDSLGCLDRLKENLYAPKIGSIVDIATNFALFGYNNEIMNDIIWSMRNIEYDLFEKGTTWWLDRKKTFRYSRYEYRMMLEEDFNKLGELRTEIRENGVTDKAIHLINNFIKYIDFGRQGYKNFWKTIEADQTTVDHIKIMVTRAAGFLSQFHDIKGELMYKNASMCRKINTGAIDFYTEDVLIDMKVKSNRGIWDRDIRQMITYYQLGKYNGFNFKKCIIFNPRYGVSYEFETENIPKDIIKEIEEKW